MSKLGGFATVTGNSSKEIKQDKVEKDDLASRTDEINSPDIATNSKGFVTPDELFGPVSPNFVGDLSNKDRGIASKQSVNKGNSQKPQSHNQKMNSPTYDTQSPTNSSKLASATKNSSNNLESAVQKTSYNDNNHENNQDYQETKTEPSNIDTGNSLKSSTVYVSRENVNNARSRFKKGLDFQSGFQTPTSYNHSNIFDENLDISNYKLDTTLLRLFSRNSNAQEPFFDYNNNMGSNIGYVHSDFIGLEPVMWRVHPMNATHKETLSMEMDFLAFHVKPRGIISRLYKDGILTSMDYNQLARTEAQGDKAVTRLMIKTLQRRGSKAYPALINALLDNGYSFVCERLSESENELRNGVLTDRAEADFKRSKEGFTPTPYKTQSPYKGLSPGYAFDNSTYPYSATPLINENYPFSETWPRTNHRSSIDHVSPLYSSLPINSAATPIDILTNGIPNRLDRHLHDLDAAFRLVHNDLISLRSANQYSRQDHVTPRNFIPQMDSVLVTSTGQVTELPNTERKLVDLKTRVTELTQYVAAMKSDNLNEDKENVSSSQRKSLETEATPPVIYHYHLEQQMDQLKSKLKELQDDLRILRVTNSQRDQRSLTRQNQSSPVYFKNDRETLDRHLRSLRSEISLLHNDVTNLKFSRTFGSRSGNSPYNTPRTSRNTTHLPLVDPLDNSENFLRSPKEPLSRTTTRPKRDLLGLDLIPGPLPPYPSYPRYPTRYNPPDDLSPRDPSPSRLRSRSNTMTPRPGNRTEVSKSNPKNDDKSKNSDKVDNNDDSYTDDDDERKSSNTPNMENNKKENDQQNAKYNKPSRTIQDKENDRVLANKEDITNSPREEKSNIDDKKGFRKKDPPLLPNDNNPSLSTDDENYGKPYSRYPTKDSPITPIEERNMQKKVPPPEADEYPAPKVQRSLPVPMIITPDDPIDDNLDPVSGHEKSSDGLGQVPEPKKKKQVRYEDTPPSTKRDLDRSLQDRPQTRAAHPQHRKKAALAKVPDRRGEIPSTTNRPTSPGDSDSGNYPEYVPVTRPKRITSPPHGLPFQRVTTPYKILRNPNSRNITTWSKKTDMSRKTRQQKR